MKKTKQVNNDGSRLKVIPLGGLEQIGLNITAFEYEDSIVVVDCLVLLAVSYTHLNLQ